MTETLKLPRETDPRVKILKREVLRRADKPLTQVIRMLVAIATQDEIEALRR